MKEYPILFSTAMVQAILSGNKTMTRRELSDKLVFNVEPDRYKSCGFDYGFALFEDLKPGETTRWMQPIKQPFGLDGDLLWVREEHLITVNGNYIQCLFKDAGAIMLHFDEITPKTLKNLKKRKTIGKWQRARFLPKDFARIWLEKTGAGVDRLHNISEDDAKNEGVLLHERGKKWLNYQDEKAKVTQFVYNCLTAKRSFLSLWGMIKNCNPYRVNPWVWVISFKVLSTTGKGAIAK